MSLRSAPRHTVTVTTVQRVPDGMGGYEDVEQPPVTRHCNVYPLSATERYELGFQAVTTYQVFDHEQQINPGAGPWPGGNHTRITWEGRTFQQEGEPMVHTMSRRTSHQRIVMTALAAKAR
ncbi:hypothetical protein [Kocuria sp. CPCC 205297]|uniref:phage head completion protein n=1 Tax=Kocuria sp. CPCC 205297 TaxID=3073558 RepID=UPI0034D48AAB